VINLANRVTQLRDVSSRYLFAEGLIKIHAEVRESAGRIILCYVALYDFDFVRRPVASDISRSLKMVLRHTAEKTFLQFNLETRESYNLEDLIPVHILTGFEALVGQLDK